MTLKKYTTFLICFFISFSACNKSKYIVTNRVYKKQAAEYAKILDVHPLMDSLGVVENKNWVGTTNFNMRKPNFVIIHHTAQDSCNQTLKTFTLTRTQVSAHYVICKDGIIYHMLNDYLRAWHAGAARWGNVTDVNSCSIGIELDNNGVDTFSMVQMQSLEKLLKALKEKYNIPTHNFIGHADIAPTRKNDPNINFNWEYFSQKGFGTWYGDTTLVSLPIDFNAVIALRIIGYEMRDTVSVIQTFKRKYLKREERTPFSESDNKIVYSVMMNSLK